MNPSYDRPPVYEETEAYRLKKEAEEQLKRTSFPTSQRIPGSDEYLQMHLAKLTHALLRTKHEHESTKETIELFNREIELRHREQLSEKPPKQNAGLNYRDQAHTEAERQRPPVEEATKPVPSRVIEGLPFAEVQQLMVLAAGDLAAENRGRHFGKALAAFVKNCIERDNLRLLEETNKPKDSYHSPGGIDGKEIQSQVMPSNEADKVFWNRYNMTFNAPNDDTVTNAAGASQSRLDARYDLIPFFVLKRVAMVLKTGTEKYGVDNWKKIPVVDHVNHAIEHAYRGLIGHSGEDHFAHAICRMMFAWEVANAPRSGVK